MEELVNEFLTKEDMLYYRHNTNVTSIVYSLHHGECIAYTIISPVIKEADKFLVDRFGKPKNGEWIDPKPIIYEFEGNKIYYHAVWSMVRSEHEGKPVILYRCGAVPYNF